MEERNGFISGGAQIQIHKAPASLQAHGLHLKFFEKTNIVKITFTRTEKLIYGSGRLGTNTEKVPMFGSQNTYSTANARHRMGDRSNELTNIRQSTDYSPFGVELKNRNLTLTGAEKMRYGFQNQEMDDEVNRSDEYVNKLMVF
jgi:hypothetical protein